MNKLILVLSICFYSLNVFGQELPAISNTITLEEAIAIALQSNHDIIIIKNETMINSNNATPGNAGLLPSLSASGGYTGSIQDSEIRFNGGVAPDQNNTGAKSNTLSGSLSANYTLFDGFGNYYQFQSLKKLEELAGVQERLQIESTMLQVIQNYLNVVLAAKSVEINEEAVQRSSERFQRVTKRFDLGNASRIDVLSAEVDLNSDKVALVQSERDLEKLKRDLLIQLGSEPDTEIEIKNEISVNAVIALDQILSDSQVYNASLVLTKLSSENAELNFKQTKSDRFPVISLNGSYDYSKSELGAGQLSYQQVNGLTGGISVSLNIFNGFQLKTRVQNAQIQLKNSQESLSLAQKSLKRDILNSYEDYQTNLLLIEKEAINLETANLNFERTKQLFELGQITNTELREAQLNVSRIEQSLILLNVQAKISEISLYQLSGQLINTDI